MVFEYNGGGYDKGYVGQITKANSHGGYSIFGCKNLDLVFIRTDANRNIIQPVTTITGDSHYPGDFQETNNSYILVGAVGQGFGSFIIKN